MTFAESLLPEFDHEMKTTRSLLERVPDDRAAWKPHGKSMSLGELAIHLAILNRFAVSAVHDDEYDFMSPTTPKFPTWESTAKTLATFDRTRDEARAAIASVSDATLARVWSLRAGERVVMSMPKRVILRSLVMNHVIHHRGQLSVYLRLNDVPLPSIYGPTADER
jgi:uncharacterized damage-inducible protein DinB